MIGPCRGVGLVVCGMPRLRRPTGLFRRPQGALQWSKKTPNLATLRRTLSHLANQRRYLAAARDFPPNNRADCLVLAELYELRRQECRPLTFVNWTSRLSLKKQPKFADHQLLDFTTSDTSAEARQYP
jgi:hypothetical protein